jgi:hypothetical protein
MACLFCDIFAHYQRQIGRRLRSDTFAISEENAHRLIHMAAQIRDVTRTTLPRVGNEAVPIILCDLFEGLSEGLIVELVRKLVSGCLANAHPVQSTNDRSHLNGERNLRQAG